MQTTVPEATNSNLVRNTRLSSVHVFGLLLGGPGQVWMNDINFEIVSTNVPTTDLVTNYPDKPVNLSFDD